MNSNLEGPHFTEVHLERATPMFVTIIKPLWVPERFQNSAKIIDSAEKFF